MELRHGRFTDTELRHGRFTDMELRHGRFTDMAAYSLVVLVLDLGVLLPVLEI
jgi:hypothetical protein